MGSEKWIVVDERRVRGSRGGSLAALVVLALLPVAARATVVGGAVGAITQVWSYADYAGVGDVVVLVTNPPAGCGSGFWIRMSDPGAKQLFAMAMSHQLAGSNVQAYAYDDQLWSGSGGQVCRLYALANHP